MKRLLPLIICLCCLLPIRASASHLVINESEDASTEKIITVGNVSITIPEGWMTITGYTDPDIKGIFCKGQSSINISYADYGADSEKPLDDEKINKMLKTFFNNIKHNYEIIDDQEEEFDFNGFPAFEEKISYKDGKGVVTCDMVSINPGSALFRVSCTTNEVEVTFCDEFEEIINSIEISE